MPTGPLSVSVPWPRSHVLLPVAIAAGPRGGGGGTALQHESSSEFEDDCYLNDSEEGSEDCLRYPGGGSGGGGGAVTAARAPAVKTVIPSGLSSLARQKSLAALGGKGAGLAAAAAAASGAAPIPSRYGQRAQLLCSPRQCSHGLPVRLRAALGLPA